MTSCRLGRCGFDGPTKPSSVCDASAPAPAGSDRQSDRRSGYAAPTASGATRLATPNYSYEKRQRELAKKRKAEEKRQRKLERTETPAPADAPAVQGDAPSSVTPAPGGKPAP